MLAFFVTHQYIVFFSKPSHKSSGAKFQFIVTSYKLKVGVSLRDDLKKGETRKFLRITCNL